MLEQKSWLEADWEEFFDLHDSILGGIGGVQILRRVTRQASFSGPNIYGKGNKRGDYLFKSLRGIYFTVLGEIKTLQTKLLPPLSSTVRIM